MSDSNTEIAVDDPTAPAEDSPAVASTRAVETVVYVLLAGLALLLGFDNWRTGMGWEAEGPQAGYFPFYIAMIMAGASLFGLARDLLRPPPGKPFVTRAQLRRVMQVFVPTLAFVPLTAWLGIYVASFLLIAGFMAIVGRIRWWISIVTGLVFAAAMFVTFQIAFDLPASQARS